MSRKVVLVIPCFNEALRLDAPRFLQVSHSQPDISFLFVNDGSTDETRQVLDQLCGASRPNRMSMLDLEQNRGKAEAVRLGMLAAARNAPEALVGYWDADLATPLEAVEEFRRVFDRMPNTAVVWGSRVRLQGRRIKRTAFRGFLGKVFAISAAQMFSISLSDTQCGAKLFHPYAIEPLFERPFRSRWIFDIEILARLCKNSHGIDGLVYETPLDEWTEKKGSKVRLRDFVQAGFELASLGLQIQREPSIELNFSRDAYTIPITKVAKAA